MFPIRDNVHRTHAPVVVWLIIAANTMAFLYEISLDHQQLQTFIYAHGLVPARYFVQSWALRVGLSPFDLTPFLTNTFLHGGVLHIVMNMWTLWIFGPEPRSFPGSAWSIPMSRCGSSTRSRWRRCTAPPCASCPSSA